MTINKQLRELAEGVKYWGNSLTHAWPSDPDFNDAWTVGSIDEDGNEYPVIEVDADCYDEPGDSEKLARFFTAAKPATVLALLEAYEALQAECEKLLKDAERYRWLRAHFGRFSESYDGGSDRVTKMVVNPDGWDVDPESLDAAIDAAMQESQS